jgi:hypothetical protein
MTMSDTVTIRLPDDVMYDVVAYAATHSLTVPQFCAKIVAEAVRTPDDIALILVDLLEMNAPAHQRREATYGAAGCSEVL